MTSKKPPTTQSRNRKRGIAEERTVADLFKHYGVPAERIPLSGAIPGLGGDVKAKEISGLYEIKVIGVKALIYEKEIIGARYVQIDLNWHGKIKKHAQDQNMRHAAVIFRGRNLRERYVILDFEEYVSLVKGFEEYIKLVKNNS